MNKISLPEIILLLLIVVPIDVLEVFAASMIGVPVIGIVFLVLCHILDWLSLFITQFYFIIKTGTLINRKTFLNLSGNAIEYVPILDILPWRTVGLILTIYSINKKTSQ